MAASDRNMTDVVIRQRYPGTDPTQNTCSYVITETDWQISNHLAYNNNGTLEIIAQVCLMQYYPFDNCMALEYWDGFK